MHKTKSPNASSCSSCSGSVPFVHSQLMQSLRMTSHWWQVHLQSSGPLHSDASQFRIRQTYQVQEVWHCWNRQIRTLFSLSLRDKDGNLGINCRGQVYSTEKAELVPEIENKTPHSGEARTEIRISDNLTHISINERIARRVSFKVGMVWEKDLPKIRAFRERTLQEMLKGALKSTPVEEVKEKNFQEKLDYDKTITMDSVGLREEPRHWDDPQSW